MNNRSFCITEATERIFDRPMSQKILDELIGYMPASGYLKLSVSGWWGSGQRWARNQSVLTSDRRQVAVQVEHSTNGSMAQATTNQYDSLSLRGIAQVVKYYATLTSTSAGKDRVVAPIDWKANGANVWSDITFNLAMEENAKVVRDLTQNSRDSGLLSAGFFEATGNSALVYTRDIWGADFTEWGTVTQARCSATVRHPKGEGSGWAGKSSYDLGRLNLSKIAQLAFEKCQKSSNPVRIEPGRYQVILEADAVATMGRLLVNNMDRTIPEGGRASAITLGADQAIGRFRSKLGLQLVDERITLSHDPTDPLVGTHSARAVNPITLIDKGILTNLWESTSYRIGELSNLAVAAKRTSFAISGGNIELDDMISTMKRGILVTRLSQPDMVDFPSLLYTGITRDGLWLVENGRISKSLRNMRWTESPLFIFNNLEQLGIQQTVFSPNESRSPLLSGFQNSLTNIAVPVMKINDFSFTSTIDAI